MKKQAQTGHGKQLEPATALKKTELRRGHADSTRIKATDANRRYDDVASALLDRARMQWQFGDWDSLVALDKCSIQDDFQRAMLALLVGAAHLQLGNQSAARSFIETALKWNCDRKVVARILIAGARNTLGRIAAVKGQEARALNHFRGAVDGVGGDQRLASQARSISEIARLNLVDQTIRMMRLQTNPCSEFAQDEGMEHAGAIEGRVQSVPWSASLSTEFPRVHSRSMKPDLRTRGRGAIVIAGMRHSGSTALFNIIRLALDQQGLEFVSFYSEGVKNEQLDNPDIRLLLIKTHEFRDDVATRADVVITTRRDLRDTVASAKRRDFPLFKRLGATEYAKYNRALHDIWREHSNYEFAYEAFMGSPLSEIRRVLRFIGLDEVDVTAIHDTVMSLPVDEYQTSLLSPSHITDPDRVLSFRDSLSEAELAKINRDHAVWLRRHGYEPQGGAS